jgi:hypothetical protein
METLPAAGAETVEAELLFAYENGIPARDHEVQTSRRDAPDRSVTYGSTRLGKHPGPPRTNPGASSK